MSQAIPHDSFLGGLNLLKRFDNRFFIEKGERPPYPIIISNPTMTDVFKNYNYADFGLLVMFTFAGKFN